MKKQHQQERASFVFGFDFGHFCFWIFLFSSLLLTSSFLSSVVVGCGWCYSYRFSDSLFLLLRLLLSRPGQLLPPSLPPSVLPSSSFSTLMPLFLFLSKAFMFTRKANRYCLVNLQQRGTKSGREGRKEEGGGKEGIIFIKAPHINYISSTRTKLSIKMPGLLCILSLFSHTPLITYH